MRPSMTNETPITGTVINNLILEYMSIASARRREEMAQSLSNTTSIESEIMAVSLRALIMNASA